MLEDGSEGPDLKKSIETKRNVLEETHANLENVAHYCEENYYVKEDKHAALEETKQYALQSLASVAYQIDALAKDLLDMLALQSDKIDSLTDTVKSAAVAVDLQKEKISRREIGLLTTNKSIPKQQKILIPDAQEPIVRYKRTPLDYSVLDGVGHGVRSSDPLLISASRTISRAASTVSGGNNPYSHYTSPMSGMNTLSRATMRAAAMSSVQTEHDYRVPQTVPIVENSRYSSLTGSSSNGPPSITSGYSGDRYGTLRAPHLPTYDNGPRTPTLHRLSPVVHENNYSITEGADDLPPPPPSSNNLFDTTADWVPEHYMRKAVALYDYEADKADELSLRASCIVYIIRMNEDGWYEGVYDGVTGLFPGNYVAPL